MTSFAVIHPPLSDLFTFRAFWLVQALLSPSYSFRQTSRLFQCFSHAVNQACQERIRKTVPAFQVLLESSRRTDVGERKQGWMLTNLRVCT